MAAFVFGVVLTLLVVVPVSAQSGAVLQGRVFDSSGSVLPGATVHVRDDSTGFDRSVRADIEGRFHIAAIPPGTYEVTASANGFRSEFIQQLRFEVGRTLVRDWYFAEGATGPFFDTWLLLANPSATQTSVEVTYLLPSGDTITRSVDLAAQSRLSVRVNDVDPLTARGGVAFHVHATGGVPIVAERSIWWPSPNYYEGHQGSGARLPAPIWRFGQGLADAESRTYLLIANFGATPGSVLVDVVYDDGEKSMRVLPIGATSRMTVDVGTLIPEANGRRFKVYVASLGTSLPLVVERSIYSDSNGRIWGSGTSILGYPITASTGDVAPSSAAPVSSPSRSRQR